MMTEVLIRKKMLNKEGATLKEGGHVPKLRVE